MTHPKQSDLDCSEVKLYCGNSCDVSEVEGDVCDPAQAENIIKSLPEDLQFVVLQPHLVKEGGSASRAGEAAMLGHKIALTRPLTKVYLGESPPRYDEPLKSEWITSSNHLLGTMADCLDPSMVIIPQSRLLCQPGSRARAERFEADGRRLTSYGKHLFSKNMGTVLRSGEEARRGLRSSSTMGIRGRPPAHQVNRLSISRNNSKKYLINSFYSGKLSI